MVVERFLDEMESDGVGRGNQVNIFRVLKTILRDAYVKGAMVDDPVKEVQEPEYVRGTVVIPSLAYVTKALTVADPLQHTAAGGVVQVQVMSGRQVPVTAAGPPRSRNGRGLAKQGSEFGDLAGSLPELDVVVLRVAAQTRRRAGRSCTVQRAIACADPRCT
ncbi:hypothetical protein ACIBAB_17210 [Streptomyces rubiginosohelvolus]|uniref:hypothetical protein n=1 Tax=Streptomyces rubiginosohelvolus TaxID=67362 RepID=UPI0037B20605